MPRWPEREGRYGEAYTGTQAKAGDSQGGPGATFLQLSGGQGVHREVESEGHEEKYRAVIDAGYLEDEPVGRRRGKVEPALWRRRRFSFTPLYQGVCGWHGTEERCVTSGELAGSPGGTGVSRPISESEVASDALSVDGRLCSTTSAAKAALRGESRVTGQPAAAVGRGRQPAKAVGKREETR